MGVWRKINNHIFGLPREMYGRPGVIIKRPYTHTNADGTKVSILANNIVNIKGPRITGPDRIEMWVEMYDGRVHHMTFRSADHALEDGQSIRDEWRKAGRGMAPCLT